jgi:2-oxoglutarate ferredoxin oxidoreductase subunit gamma
MKVRFAGFGGQGIVLCGMIFGKAAMLDGKRSIQTQSYGSASRGGLTRSDVCIQDEEIFDLIYEEFDVIVALSQQSYASFAPFLAKDGLLFYESDLVRPDQDLAGRSHGIPATDIAHKEFGRRIIANMIVMGFVNRMTGIISSESLVATVRESVPAGTEDLNERALDAGAKLADEAVGEAAR